MSRTGENENIILWFTVSSYTLLDIGPCFLIFYSFELIKRDIRGILILIFRFLFEVHNKNLKESRATVFTLCKVKTVRTKMYFGRNANGNINSTHSMITPTQNIKIRLDCILLKEKNW